jgi:4,5-dihydroxyphthalate decarboxylase
LKSEYGVDLDSITWITEEDAHVQEYRDPPNVVRTKSGESLQALLLRRDIEAAIGLRQTNPNDVRTVIPDADDAASAWYRKTEIYPVNHVLAVRDDLLGAHSWLAEELVALFTTAKQRAHASAVPVARADTSRARLMDLVGDDPLPYGMASNLRSIEMLLKFAADQALTPKTYRAADLFAQSC